MSKTNVCHVRVTSFKAVRQALFLAVGSSCTNRRTTIITTFIVAVPAILSGHLRNLLQERHQRAGDSGLTRAIIFLGDAL